MSKRSIILSVTTFILLITGMFAFTYIQKSNQDKNVIVTNNTAPAAEDKELPWYFADGVTAKHFYIDGTHTLAGEVTLPTPCDLLETKTVVRESYPEQVELQFSIINTADNCADVLTTQRFKVSAVASKDAVISATYDGLPVNLNLIPAAPGETPEEFEIFIKG
ncbi:MAG: hypothetical protein H6779_00105 [Candidatus Nomurabacteria bacterium]|nr:MAG: hypothetical protein H6779_00105 [Candidatus Nomurabacteria bacterium]